MTMNQDLPALPSNPLSSFGVDLVSSLNCTLNCVELEQAIGNDEKDIFAKLVSTVTN